MIIKIKTTKLDDMKIVSSWVYFDGFRKVKTFDLEEEEFLTESLKSTTDYVAVKDHIKGDQKDDTPDSGVIILCTRRDGSEYTIATNQLTYLLNDDGKTIERLM